MLTFFKKPNNHNWRGGDSGKILNAFFGKLTFGGKKNTASGTQITVTYAITSMQIHNAGIKGNNGGSNGENVITQRGQYLTIISQAAIFL